MLPQMAGNLPVSLCRRDSSKRKAAVRITMTFRKTPTGKWCSKLDRVAKVAPDGSLPFFPPSEWKDDRTNRAKHRRGR